MPLVVPGLMSNDKSKDSQWLNQLMGKKIGDQSDELTFAKKDLPEDHRIIRPGEMTSLDSNPDRLNIHLAEDGTVANVKHG